MIRISVLGTARIATSDNEMRASGQQSRRVALLGYLAIARPHGAHRRDTILAMLWPELDQDRARAALRQALHGIRRAFGADVVLSHGSELLELNREAVTCDLWDVERALDGGDELAAIRLGQGELLAGLFISEAPAFEHWLDTERNRIRAELLGAAWKAGDRAIAARAAHDVVVAMTTASRMIGYDEAALRRIMRTLVAVGAKTEALSIFDRFRHDVLQELETEPDAETIELSLQLRAVAASTDHSALHATPAKQQPKPTPVDTVPTVARPTFERATRPGARAIATLATAAITMFAVAPLAMSDNSEADPRVLRIEVSSNAAPAELGERIGAIARHALGKVEGVAVVATEGRRTTKAGTLVRIEVSRLPSGFELSAEVVDTRSGTISGDARVTGASAANIDSLLDAFGEAVTVSVATSLYPGWGRAMSRPVSFEGYKRFAEGMRKIKSEEHSAAIAAFRQAFEADSNFTVAGLLAGIELYHVGRYATADSIAKGITSRRAQLSPVDERLLEWLSQSLRGDRIAARAAMQRVTELAPEAALAWLQLAIDNVETARPETALTILERIAPAADSGDAWPGYWSAKIEALHLLGQHERELATAREGMSRNPEINVLAAYELRALAALGRVDELVRLTDARASLVHDATVLLREVAMELAAHGHPAASRKLLLLVRERDTRRVASDSASTLFVSGLARTQYMLDNRAEAHRHYAALLEQVPECAVCAGSLGVLAARDGRRAEAMHFDTLLASMNRPFGFGRATYFRARIRAALQDTAVARKLLSEAFARGFEYDVLTHADPDLVAINPDSVYKSFARVGW